METSEARAKATFSPALLSPGTMSSTPRSSLISTPDSQIHPWAQPFLCVPKPEQVHCLLAISAGFFSKPPELNTLTTDFRTIPVNRVQFQCPHLRQWPGHSNKWGSQQLSGLPHPQSNLCSGSVLPQHLLFTRHISPSHCPSRDCSHLTGLSTSLLPHHSPFSLQTAIKSDCLFISHPALYAGNSWTHCSRDKTQTSHFGPQDPALQSGAVQS